MQQVWTILQFFTRSYARLSLFRILILLFIAYIGVMYFIAEASIQDHEKMIFDFTALFVQLTSMTVIVYWGGMLTASHREDRSFEVLLAGPVSRPAFIIGNFLGLIFCLFIYLFILAILWYGFVYLFVRLAIDWSIIGFWLYQYLGLVIMASMAVCLAYFAEPATCLFILLGTWISGLLIRSIEYGLAEDTSPIIRSVISTTRKIWDLGKFYVVPDEVGPISLLPYYLLYSLSLVGFFLGVTCIFVDRKDM